MSTSNPRTSRIVKTNEDGSKTLFLLKDVVNVVIGDRRYDGVMLVFGITGGTRHPTLVLMKHDGDRLREVGTFQESELNISHIEYVEGHAENRENIEDRFRRAMALSREEPIMTREFLRGYERGAKLESEEESKGSKMAAENRRRMKLESDRRTTELERRKKAKKLLRGKDLGKGKPLETKREKEEKFLRQIRRTKRGENTGTEGWSDL